MRCLSSFFVFVVGCTAIAQGQDCNGPYDPALYSECEERILYLVVNWNNGGEPTETYIAGGIDGSRCSIQYYLAVQERANGISPTCPVPEGYHVSVSGNQLVFNGETFFMKGVNWNPIPKGESQLTKTTSYYDDYVEQDGILLEDLGVNVIRTYEPILNLSVLDRLFARGIRVISPIYPDVNNVIDTTKGHPAILMWYIGQEWNNNLLFEPGTFEATKTKVNDAAILAKALDPTRPVATVYGDLPDQSTVNDLPDIDVWGATRYRGISFGDLFTKWQTLSSKPFFVAEYGADAYNMNQGFNGSEDQESQAFATTELSQEIVDASTVLGGICSGGLIFEFADEWWKSGGVNTQDVLVNTAPAPIGPYPDLNFNEDWWGLVDIDRVPRLAFNAFKEVGFPVSPAPTATTEKSSNKPIDILILAGAIGGGSFILIAISTLAFLASRRRNRASKNRMTVNSGKSGTTMMTTSTEQTTQSRSPFYGEFSGTALPPGFDNPIYTPRESHNYSVQSDDAIF